MKERSPRVSELGKPSSGERRIDTMARVAYLELIDRWLTDPEMDLREEVAYLADGLERMPQWQDHEMRMRIRSAYQFLWGRAAFDSDALAKIACLISVTNDNPARWHVPFDGLEDDIETALTLQASQGQLHAVEMITRLTGQELTAEQRLAALGYAWRNLFDPVRSREPASVGGLPHFEEEEAYLLEQGVAELPSAQRQSLMRSAIKTGLRVIPESLPGTELLARMVEIIEGAINQDDPYLWSQEFDEALEEFMVRQEFGSPSEYRERLPLIQRLRAITHLDASKMPLSEKKRLLFGCITNWDVTALRDLEPFFDAVLPGLALTQQDKDLLCRPLSKCADRLRELGGSNPLFIEQMTAFLKWGLLSQAVVSSYVQSWRDLRIRVEGFLFDPTPGHLLVDRGEGEWVPPVYVLTNSEQSFRSSQGRMDVPQGPIDTIEELARVLRQEHDFDEDGPSDTFIKILQESSVSLEEKKVFLKNALSYTVFRESSPYYDDDSESGRKHDDHIGYPLDFSHEAHAMQTFLRCVDVLPFSAVQREELVQAFHLFHYDTHDCFYDPAGQLPRVDLTHPDVWAWRLEHAKRSLDGQSDLFQLEKAIQLLPRFCPGNIPFSDWPPEEQERYILPLGTPEQRKAFLERQRSQAGVTDKMAEGLMKIFAKLTSKGFSSLDEREGVNALIFLWDSIPGWCARVPGFQEAYDTWVAVRLAVYRSKNQMLDASDFRLYHSQYPNMDHLKWSVETRARAMAMAIERGVWQEVDELIAQSSEGRELLYAQEKQFFIEKMKSLKNAVVIAEDPSWLIEVLQKRRSLLEQVMKEDQEVAAFYQEAIGSLIEGVRYDYYLPAAPSIDFKNEFIQKGIATRVAGLLFLENMGSSKKVANDPSKDEETKKSIVREYLRTRVPFAEELDWDSAWFKEATEKYVVEFVPQESLIPGFAPQIIQRFEHQTGLLITDERYLLAKIRGFTSDLLDDESSFAVDVVYWVDRWRKLHERLGRPLDEKRMKDLITQGLDECCPSNGLTLKDIQRCEAAFSYKPSPTAIRGRILYQLRNEGEIGDGLELAANYRTSVELSPEEIRSLAPFPARVEACIYATLLPKKGKERIEAERLFRSRSALADTIPELLAIQSPAKRNEFCPYEQKLQKMFEADPAAFDLSQEEVRKGLLIFLKRFGMENLPLLAQSVIALVTQSQQGGGLISKNHPALRELSEIIQPSKEECTLEEYLAQIEQKLAAIRTDLLKDRPLDSRIERSALGMELFNALVPHVGNYQDTSDRSHLIAETRVHGKKLTRDPMYTPATYSVEVSIAQELEGLTEVSPTDRAIRVQREFIAKKFQDETLQKFLQEWQRAAERIRGEPSVGSTGAFSWLTLVKTKWQLDRHQRQESLNRPLKELARENIQKEITRLDERIAQVKELIEKGIALKKAGGTSEPLALLEDLQSLFKTPAGKIDRVKLEADAGEAARGLCLLLMRERSRAHYEAIMTATQQSPGKNGLSVPQVRAWETWFREEYLEHFAGLRTDAQAELPPSVQALFQKLWRTDGLQTVLKARREGTLKGSTSHPIIDTFDSIAQAELQITALEKEGIVKEKQDLTFWPVKGLGRALSGDIANACFHRWREDLAQGDYPNLTAVLMTLPGHAEIAGSVLFIEAETRSKKRVLVIRALNPTEAVVRELDPVALVQATIAYAQKVVEERARGTGVPFDEIRLCVDQCGGHSTNRQRIAEAEKALVACEFWLPGESLISTPETNFNGYAIWDRTQTVVVQGSKK